MALHWSASGVAPALGTEELNRSVAEKLRARRATGGYSKTIMVLAGIAVLLLAVIVVYLLNSPIFREPTALELAREELIAALEASPGDPGLLMSLAEVEYELGRRGDAFDHAEQAVANGPEVKYINMRYAMLLLKEERVEMARTAVEAEIALFPKDAEANFLLAQILTQEGDYDAALAAAQVSTEQSYTNGDYRMLYAQILHKAGRVDEAIAAYERALQVLPGDKRAIDGLAELGVTWDASGTVNPHQTETESGE